MYKLLLFLIISVFSLPVFSQSVVKSYHPVNPNINGSFIANGTIDAQVNGAYSYNGTSLVINGGSIATLAPHYNWDIVHKPYGVGAYSFSLLLNGVEYPLADFFVDSAYVHIVKLYNGSRVATDTFWAEGTSVSHWQIGKYLAAVVNIQNINIPRCSSLVIKTGENVNLELVTVVTTNPDPCSIQRLCIKKPEELVRNRFATDNLVFITRFPIIYQVLGLQYLQYIRTSRHPVDVYDSYAVALQVSLNLYPTDLSRLFYSTSLLAFTSSSGNFPDYTVRETLSGYLNSRPSSNAHTFFGELVKQIVLSNNNYCPISTTGVN